MFESTSDTKEREIAYCQFVCFRQGQLCIRCLRGVERDDMSSMLDGDDDDRSAISSLILPSGQDSPREDLVNTKLIKFDVSFVYLLKYRCAKSLLITAARKFNEGCSRKIHSNFV